uniref:WD_REPEATS_REGION domain-containing protein n=1 Tax=Caenorhabditis japonica TaxID=281687 RepID=A0A8R1DSX4_CAEJA
MDHYMPQIFWHDRQGLLSVDIHRTARNNRYKIVTSSVQKEVRIWEFEFENVENSTISPLAVSFVANLVFHNQAVNCVRFSPSEEHNLLASGDCEGRVTIWKVSDSPALPPQDEMPPNKENWVRHKILNHNSDVNALCWNPSGTHVASVSNDHSLAVHDALTGLRTFTTSNFRSPNGVFWDPQGKYIVTMSPDRRMDIVDAAKGTRLKFFSTAALPARVFPTSSGGEIRLEEKMHKLFHDDQLFSFQRSLAFSPNGEFIAAPCAHLELSSSDLYGTYFFKREDLATKDAPFAFYPCPRPTFLIRFSPVHLTLLNCAENHLGLPYRLVWIALNKDAIYFYDSQHSQPIGVVDNIHFNALTDASWSPDGKVLVISSLEGYCSFIKFSLDAWGEVVTEILPACSSPNMIEEKKRKRKIIVPSTPVENKEETVSSKSPMRKDSKCTTPLTKFFKKKEEKNNDLDGQKPEGLPPSAPKNQKRIQLVTINN